MILRNSRVSTALIKLALLPQLGTMGVKALGAGAMLGTGMVGKGARFAVRHPKLSLGGLAATMPIASGVQGFQQARAAGLQRRLASQFGSVPYEQQYFR